MVTNKTYILFLVPYPIGKGPSQRFRVEQFLPLLEKKEYQYKMVPFWSGKSFRLLYSGGSILQKAAGLISGYFRRFYTVLVTARKYDYVFVQREAAPLGPPVFEWIVVKLLRKKLIYDFDDAIWLHNTSSQNGLVSGLKATWKVGKICSWVHIAVGGNDYLCEYARSQGARKVVKIPTVVDTERRYLPQKEHGIGKVVIGWTGSHSTLKYIDEVVPALEKLQEKYDFRFLVIADKKPELKLRDWQYLPWNEQTEIEDLLKMDIGIMPLSADLWSEGKCGFKLIQYLSLGIPAVASPVGVNKIIVTDGINGYHATTSEVWESSLEMLLQDAALRTQMGVAGRELIVAQYSIAAVKRDFLLLFA